jgi:hypothetical protein
MAELFDNQGLMGLIGGGQSPTTPTQGGGMFDAYSPQNQTNMQMAMIADMIGNFAGKDVGAMKTMMPLAENARKLRLQNEQRDAISNALSGANPAMQTLGKYYPQAFAKGMASNMNRDSFRPASQAEIDSLGLTLKQGQLLQVNTRTGQYDIKGGAGMSINNFPKNQLADVFSGQIKTAMDAGAESGGSARQSLPMINNMIDLLESGRFDTGMGAEYALDAKRAFQTLGFDVDDDTIANAEAFVGQSNKIILPEVKLLGVNPTDKDLDFIVKGSPDLSKSKRGNMLMLKALQVSKQRAIAMQDHMENWLENEGVKFQHPGAFLVGRNKARRTFNNNPFSAAISSLRSSVNAEVKSNQAIKGDNAATGRPTSHNPSTGETAEWDGTKWVSTGGGQ